MTGALPPELAAAYVRELSADVRAVVVLDPGGGLLAGPPALAGPAAALARELGHGAVNVPDGLVIVARGHESTVVAVVDGRGLPGPHLLDAAAAAASASAPALIENPPDPLRSVVFDVFAAL